MRLLATRRDEREEQHFVDSVSLIVRVVAVICVLKHRQHKVLSSPYLVQETLT
jgi:hypothetical protein